jgi:hypothetical protein
MNLTDPASRSHLSTRSTQKATEIKSKYHEMKENILVTLARGCGHMGEVQVWGADVRVRHGPIEGATVVVRM